MTSHEKQKSTHIDRRDDVNPNEGEHKYGDVEFADPVNNKYPVDTPEHVRAAWSYIHHKDNTAKYDADEVRQIEGRIKRAAKKHGVEIEADSKIRTQCNQIPTTCWRSVRLRPAARPPQPRRSSKGVSRWLSATRSVAHASTMAAIRP